MPMSLVQVNKDYYNYHVTLVYIPKRQMYDYVTHRQHLATRSTLYLWNIITLHNNRGDKEDCHDV